MAYPRVLIISNDCLSQSSSNGRTLRNFLVGWPKEALAQFYIQPNRPDFTLCDRYFCVTDGQALRAFLDKGHGGGAVTEATLSAEDAAGIRRGSGARRYGRNALTMLVRELVWNSGRWDSEAFRRWVEEFSPELILLQAGDSGFMLRLARTLAERYDVPLVVYNSESYYFKKFDYLRGKGLAHWCYPIFRWHLRTQTRKTLRRAAKSIYICEPLQREYDREFCLPSETVYTATDMRRREATPENPVFRAAYLGNLGVGRHEVLVEVANTLREISPELCLDVYGGIPSEEVRQALERCPGIRYQGFVSYGEVLRVMAESDLLVHGESFDPFYKEDLKFAFSTKLADSLASGTCFLLYAPEEIACARYLRENDAAWVVSDREALETVLRRLVEEPESREKYLTNAAVLVEKNHNAEKNAARFQEILKEAARKG